MNYEPIGPLRKAEGLEILEGKRQKEIEKSILFDIRELLKIPEYKIGEGSTAQVFYPKKGSEYVCYKIFHRNPTAYAKRLEDVPEEYHSIWSGNGTNQKFPWRNSGHREMEITDKLREIDSEVGIPSMYLSHELEGSEEGGKYWVSDNVEVIVMSRVMDAVDLEQLVIRKIDLPEGFDIDAFCAKLEKFFAKAHDMGVYHRDVGPRNIMIDLKTHKPYVIDYGMGTDSVLGDEDPYAQEVTIEGQSRRVVFNTDEHGLSLVKKHLHEYSEFMKDR